MEAFKVNILYGHVDVKSEMRLEGDRLVGYSRKLSYDRDGRLTESGEWQPTGATCWFPDPLPWGIFGWLERRRRAKQLRELADER